MAVDTLARTAAKILEKSDVCSINLEKCTSQEALASPHDTAVASETKQTTSSIEAVRKAKLKRERAGLVKHMYSIMNTDRELNPTESSISSDVESPNESDEWENCYDYDLKFQRRKTGNCRRSRRERTTPLKEQKFEDFCRKCQTPEDITLERGRKKTIRAQFYECTKRMTRYSNCREQNVDRKANIEKKLRKLGVKRLQECVAKRNSPSYREDRASNRFALRAENVPQEMQDMVDFLLGLQDREITPEDYELLLRLDESVSSETVSNERLNHLEEDTVSVDHEHEICSICMENYEVGQTRKTLPCGHAFHSSCIVTWLGQSSTKCPLDRWEI